MKEHLEAAGHMRIGGSQDIRQGRRLFKRKVKEAIFIHKHRPSLNRDKGLEPLPSTLHSCHMTHMGHVTPKPEHNATEKDAAMDVENSGIDFVKIS